QKALLGTPARSLAHEAEPSPRNPEALKRACSHQKLRTRDQRFGSPPTWCRSRAAFARGETLCGIRDLSSFSLWRRVKQSLGFCWSGNIVMLLADICWNCPLDGSMKARQN